MRRFAGDRDSEAASRRIHSAVGLEVLAREAIGEAGDVTVTPEVGSESAVVLVDRSRSRGRPKALLWDCTLPW